MTTLITRIFKNGNSQAVRIPQEFRLDVTQVEISRNPNGDLVIHPLPINRGEALFAALNQFDNDFAALLEEDYSQQPVMQDREALISKISSHTSRKMRFVPHRIRAVEPIGDRSCPFINAGM